MRATERSGSTRKLLLVDAFPLHLSAPCFLASLYARLNVPDDIVSSPAWSHPGGGGKANRTSILEAF